MSDDESEENRDPIDQMLEWIGFNEDERVALSADFSTLEDYGKLTEKDIISLQEGYSRRAANQGGFYFGLQRTVKLKNAIHWVQDFARCNLDPTLYDLEEDEFLEALDVAAERAQIRKAQADDSEAVSRDTSPGNLKDEKKWIEWSEKLETMLAVMPGVNGVPLSYVIRKKDESDHEEANYENFMQYTVACAPLNGTFFEADARRVHQIILGYIQGEAVADWIKPHLKKENGRLDMIALRKHFEGEGNVSRRITDAESLRDTLHYKAERALPFSQFITKCQLMFNIYRDEGEEFSENQKLRFFLDKIQSDNQAMQIAVSTLRLRMDSGDDLTFTFAANHLTSAVARIAPKAVAFSGRNISGVAGGASQGGGGDEPIYRNGAIFTGYYKTWNSLSADDKQKVNDERKRLGVLSKRSSGKFQGGRQANHSGGGKGQKRKSRINKVKSQLAEAERTIASMASQSGKSVHFDTTGDKASDDAGNGFGGRNEKKSRKS